MARDSALRRKVEDVHRQLWAGRDSVGEIDFTGPNPPFLAPWPEESAPWWWKVESGARSGGCGPC